MDPWSCLVRSMIGNEDHALPYYLIKKPGSDKWAMECLTAGMIVLLPVVRVLVLLPPLHGLWVSLGSRLMMMMEWNWFQKLKRSKMIPQRSPESMLPETFGGEYNCLFGDSLWEDPHCFTAYTQAESLDKEAQGRRCIFLPLRWLWFSRMKE
nr:hypothetical protein CFP56_64060 [Quercus suber]